MQRKRTKTFKVKKSSIEKSKRYSIEDALQLVLESSYEKFDPSLELHIRTGIDPRKGDQVVRGSVVLPYASGKTKKIAVFAEGDKAKEALAAGVDIVGGQEMIDQSKQTGKADFDIAIATPDMMKALAGVARVLGPRGLMPSPKNNTVTANVRAAIEEVKKGRLDFKNDTGGTVHIMIGKKSLEKEKLLANYTACMEALRKARPSTVKGAYIRTISLSSTMGPGIFVQP